MSTRIFSQKKLHEKTYFSMDPYSVILAWVQSWNNSENWWNCDVRTNTFHVIYISWFWHRYKIERDCLIRQNFFTKTCLMNNHFSCDPHYVILAWMQNRNISEKFMKLWSPPEFFHKNMSHEQLLLMWSMFRDSSMDTKLKYFWKTHESV